ncbi:MAG TPA: Holliday junction resolvase RuvX [Bacteroidales bacterium]|nr:MAG: Holliday junction DNA helicase RuvA [Bacteroidetes bacterium GWE2_42_24]OFY31642.1 MAG: Holliday junction DNA helicase RuvA [Bacteroidetes bacterium GWF2_43_11]PKP24155.1 MAG: Holliday junction resolvase RuvX [Bacteroidetes bacterium HGW-Bacteroidetes-22]HAQ64449.1 Holliday junction resolvase RuvX [Bacteroidales bacterium]HBZ67101.1 Holliday junction resolvase RuvX [Bacteroidales bacterium]
MGRILAIDYGQKRVGLAATDELQISANALTTVHVSELFDWLTQYLNNEKVDGIVVGEPRTMNNLPSDASRFIEPFVNRLRKVFPQTPVYRYDERFTSVLAHRTMLEAGLKKKDRQDKALVDRISAVILLQSFMESNQFKNI